MNDHECWKAETLRADVAEARAKELQEEIGQRDYALGCAKQMQDWQQNRWEAAESRLVECEGVSLLREKSGKVWERQAHKAEARCAELEALFALQQTRMAEATEAWRKATGKQDTLPDLGDLLTWLMDRPAALEKAARQVIKASPKYVGKDMLLALAELDTVLAEAQGGALIGVLVEEKKDPWPTVTSWPQEGKEESREM